MADNDPQNGNDSTSENKGILRRNALKLVGGGALAGGGAVAGNWHANNFQYGEETGNTTAETIVVGEDMARSEMEEIILDETKPTVRTHANDAVKIRSDMENDDEAYAQKVLGELLKMNVEGRDQGPFARLEDVENTVYVFHERDDFSEGGLGVFNGQGEPAQIIGDSRYVDALVDEFDGAPESHTEYFLRDNTNSRTIGIAMAAASAAGQGINGISHLNWGGSLNYLDLDEESLGMLPTVIDGELPPTGEAYGDGREGRAAFAAGAVAQEYLHNWGGEHHDGWVDYEPLPESEWQDKVDRLGLDLDSAKRGDGSDADLDNMPPGKIYVSPMTHLYWLSDGFHGEDNSCERPYPPMRTVKSDEKGEILLDDVYTASVPPQVGCVQKRLKTHNNHANQYFGGVDEAVSPKEQKAAGDSYSVSEDGRWLIDKYSLDTIADPDSKGGQMLDKVMDT